MIKNYRLSIGVLGSLATWQHIPRPTPADVLANFCAFVIVVVVLVRSPIRRWRTHWPQTESVTGRPGRPCSASGSRRRPRRRPRQRPRRCSRTSCCGSRPPRRTPRRTASRYSAPVCTASISCGRLIVWNGTERTGRGKAGLQRAGQGGPRQPAYHPCNPSAAAPANTAMVIQNVGDPPSNEGGRRSCSVPPPRPGGDGYTPARPARPRWASASGQPSASEPRRPPPPCPPGHRRPLAALAACARGGCSGRRGLCGHWRPPSTSMLR